MSREGSPIEIQPSDREVLDAAARMRAILDDMRASRWRTFRAKVGYVSRLSLEKMKTAATAGLVIGALVGGVTGGGASGAGALPGSVTMAGAFGGLGAAGGALEGIVVGTWRAVREEPQYREWMRDAARKRFTAERARSAEDAKQNPHHYVT